MTDCAEPREGLAEKDAQLLSLSTLGSHLTAFLDERGVTFLYEDLGAMVSKVTLNSVMKRTVSKRSIPA